MPSTDAVPDESPTESTVKEILLLALRMEDVGLEEDFFQLGGDSLQAVNFIADLTRCFNVDIPFGAIFDNASTVAGMARLIDALHADGSGRWVHSRPRRLSRDEALPASFTQQGFWVSSQLFRDQPINNVVKAVRLGGDLDPDRLGQALASVIERQESLRVRLDLKRWTAASVPDSAR